MVVFLSSCSEESRDIKAQVVIPEPLRGTWYQGTKGNTEGFLTLSQQKMMVNLRGFDSYTNNIGEVVDGGETFALTSRNGYQVFCLPSKNGSMVVTVVSTAGKAGRSVRVYREASLPTPKPIPAVKKPTLKPQPSGSPKPAKSVPVKVKIEPTPMTPPIQGTPVTGSQQPTGQPDARALAMILLAEAQNLPADDRQSLLEAVDRLLKLQAAAPASQDDVLSTLQQLKNMPIDERRKQLDAMERNHAAMMEAKAGLR